jgi:ATP-dependent helicase/nuclease subunit B
MTNRIDHYSSLFNQIDDQTLVITATSRLAKVLTKAYIQKRVSKSQGKILLNNPIQSLQTLTDHLWHHLSMVDGELPIVVSKPQAHLLWLKAISDDPEQIQFQLNKTARLAASAWQILREWDLDEEVLLSEKDNSNTEAFLKWLSAFQRFMGKWIIGVERLGYLSQHALLSSIFHYQRVIYVGFDTLTPQFKNFCDILNQYDISASEWTLADNKPEIKAYGMPSENDELYHVADQIKAYLKHYPHHHVGVICHSLQTKHKAITRVFDEILGEPNTISENISRPYTISGGMSLFDVPIINDMLAIVSLKVVSDYEVISQVIRSPYIEDAGEYQDVRALLDIQCRKYHYREMSLAELLGSQKLPDNFKEVLPCLYVYQDIYTQGEYPWATFVGLALKLLAAVAWPGLPSLSSEDYQAVQQLYALFDTLQSLQAATTIVTFSGGIQQLKQLTQETLFQPESNHLAQIDVLGILEASTIVYDRIWCLEMGENAWPSASSSNALISPNILKQYAMPHCSSERELAFAQQVTQRMLRQAPVVTLSYCLWQDETEQSLSPLFQDIVVENFPEESISTLRQSEHLLGESLSSEPMMGLVSEEDYIAEMSEHELKEMKGGSQILQSMAQCPFRSALKHRLKLDAFPEYMTPLDAMQKGIFVHAVLEGVWREIGSSKTLQSLSDAMLCENIEHCVESVVTKYERAMPKTLRYLLKIEKMRLIDVIFRWLNYEKQRVEEFDVVAFEQPFVAEIDGLTLNLRIDRIDQLASGSLVVIDYKTSKNLTIQSWINSRVSEPQLPIYALFQDADAIAYAQVNNANMELKAISDVPEWITDKLPKPIGEDSKVKEFDSWTEIKSYWKERLSQHVEAFKGGDIQLIQGSCEYCDFMDICRVDSYT